MPGAARATAIGEEEAKEQTEKTEEAEWSSMADPKNDTSQGKLEGRAGKAIQAVQAVRLYSLYWSRGMGDRRSLMACSKQTTEHAHDARRISHFRKRTRWFELPDLMAPA